MRWSIVYGRPVRELQAALSSAEFGELLAFETIEGPVGPWRQDYLFARVLHQAASFAAARGRSRRRFKVADFMPPWWVEPPTPKSAREIEAKLEAWAAGLTPRKKGG